MEKTEEVVGAQAEVLQAVVLLNHHLAAVLVYKIVVSWEMNYLEGMVGLAEVLVVVILGVRRFMEVAGEVHHWQDMVIIFLAH